jgi:proteasome lid subunit RPN8/RPN11
MVLAFEVERIIVAHARDSAPNECCGLLVGDDTTIVEAVPARNLALEPKRRYLVDPQDHLGAIRAARARGFAVVGAYHSHPHSSAIPSATDAAEGFGQFLFVIVGLAADPPELTAWRWANGNFTAVPLVRVREGEG